MYACVQVCDLCVSLFHLHNLTSSHACLLVLIHSTFSHALPQVVRTKGSPEALLEWMGEKGVEAAVGEGPQGMVKVNVLFVTHPWLDDFELKGVQEGKLGHKK